MLTIFVDVSWQKGKRYTFEYTSFDVIRISNVKESIYDQTKIETKNQIVLDKDGYTVRDDLGVIDKSVFRLYFRVKVLNFSQILNKIHPELEGYVQYDRKCGFTPIYTDKLDFPVKFEKHIEKTYCTGLSVHQNGLFFFKNNTLSSEDDLLKQNIGYCNFYLNENKKDLHIYTFCSRKGYGRHIMNYIIDIFFSHDLNNNWKVTLESVYSAIGFYRKMGFKFEKEDVNDSYYFDMIWTIKSNIETFDLLMDDYCMFSDIITRIQTKNYSRKETILKDKTFLGKRSSDLLNIYSKEQEKSLSKKKADDVKKRKTSNLAIEEFKNGMWKYLNLKFQFFTPGFDSSMREAMVPFTNAKTLIEKFSKYWVFECGLPEMVLNVSRDRYLGQCILCESEAKFDCGGCHIAYCSEECAQRFWNNGHKECCGDE